MSFSVSAVSKFIRHNFARHLCCTEWTRGYSKSCSPEWMPKAADTVQWIRGVFRGLLGAMPPNPPPSKIFKRINTDALRIWTQWRILPKFQLTVFLTLYYNYTWGKLLHIHWNPKHSLDWLRLEMRRIYKHLEIAADNFTRTSDSGKTCS